MAGDFSIFLYRLKSKPFPLCLSTFSAAFCSKFFKPDLPSVTRDSLRFFPSKTLLKTRLPDSKPCLPIALPISLPIGIK
ncbi:unnamed protein product [Meloidogyne enterolobii]|uniref:Uncharacterized protein n=1 Tax=Meloidogyne enterolobii TaxID=390850 RepID=A0ACB1AHD9_MELEN